MPSLLCEFRCSCTALPHSSCLPALNDLSRPSLRDFGDVFNELTLPSRSYEVRYTFVQDDAYYCVMPWTAAVAMWHSTAALIDILISSTYIFQLCRRLRGVPRTVGAETVLRLIVRMVVQSAAFTATFAILAAATTLAYLEWNLMSEDIYYFAWIVS